MKTSTIALATAMLTAAAPAVAQDKSWTADIVVTGEREGYQATEASTLRTPVSIQETPQSVQVLTQTLLEEQDVTTLSDALRNVSGVVPAAPSETVLVKPIVRGFSSEIYVDGMPQYGDASTYDPSSLIGVERIEVAKGPTSQLFSGGTGAPVGGLINVVSVSPSLTPAYRAEIRGGSFKTVQPAIDINQPLSETVAIRLAAEYSDADDAIDIVNTDRVTLSSAVQIGFGDTSLIVRAHYNNISQLEYAGLPFAMADFPGVDPFQYSGATDQPDTTIENVAVSGAFTHKLSEDVTAQVRVRSYNNTVNEFGSFPYIAFYPPTGTVYPIITAIMPNVRINELTFDANLTAIFATGGIEHVVIAGAQYDTIDYHGTMGFNFVPVGVVDYLNPNSPLSFGPTDYPYNRYVNTYGSLGFYAQDQMTLGGRVHVLIGLRYNRLETKEGFDGLFSPKHRLNHVDPRVGVTFDVTKGVSIFGGYATGSRAAVFFNPMVTPSVPETSKSWEGGVKLAVTSIGLSGTIAAFHQTRNHVPLNDPLGVTYQIGQQRAKGVEADVIWEPSKRFSLLANYAYTKAQVTENSFDPAAVGQHLTRVPTHSGRVAARYRFTDGPLGGFSIGVGMTAASGAYTTLPNTDKTDGYAVFDAQASYETGPFRIGVSVVNLTDELYYTPYLYLNQSVVRPGNPRSAYVTVGVQF